MKTKLMKLISSTCAFMIVLATKVLAADNAWSTSPNVGSVGGEAETVMGEISKFVKPIAAILVFGSVLIIGFEIIMNRNKADDRMKSMTSLMWVGIGTLVIAFAALIANFLFVK